MKFKFLKAASALLFALALGNANAVIIPADIQITGQVTFADGTNGSVPAGNNALQTATMKSIIGGVLSTSTVDDTTVTGSNPRGGQLTDLLDGIGLNAMLSSNGLGYADAFVFDYNFEIVNSSITDDYIVSFAIDYDLSVDSATRAYVDNRLILENPAETPAEFFFSDLTSDTEDGNTVNGVGTGNNGGTESDAGIFTFDITVNAGETKFFTGEIKLDGESFLSNSSMIALNDSFISVTAAQSTSNPPRPPTDVSEPSSVLLLLSGLFALGIKRRVAKKHSK
jgi:hypothetical protein